MMTLDDLIRTLEDLHDGTNGDLLVEVAWEECTYDESPILSVKLTGTEYPKILIDITS